MNIHDLSSYFFGLEIIPNLEGGRGAEGGRGVGPEVRALCTWSDCKVFPICIAIRSWMVVDLWRVKAAILYFILRKDFSRSVSS